ncbi:hypothetical protein TBR22_A51380 [Luteitalea sp. TBR-22]|uniref:HupE/UreJ family protein n=1 Tax=Luteitalea sp. TBR-22 TaxID=2802971 RepID=UPI001EF55CB6|nr:HupE/UreJ family protein [Luteitalea sp. TBR-22]BCS35903.2 hypothetical protein TBR22_A51380 [Luteitalea sp. TBR-22]
MSPTVLRAWGARALLAWLVLLHASPAVGHAGSTAFWRVVLDAAGGHAVVLLPFEDAVRLAPGLPRSAGELGVDRLGALDEAVRNHFLVIEGGVPAEARVLGARMLASGLIELQVAHRLSGSGAVVLRSTFHRVTDDSHAVVTRIERHGRGESFVLTATASERLVRRADDASAPPSGVLAMVRLGIAHILTGYDHLVFLACLLVPSASWRARVGLVSAFTAAHSLTLVLGAMRIITPPAGFVEPAIALSIAYVAIENLLDSHAVRPDGLPLPSSRRWPAAFVFGLVHGLGFAGTLDVIGLPARAWITAVLAFNAGVEIGQLAAIVLAAPLVVLAARSRWHRPLVQSTSVLVLGLAFVWFVERLS